MFSPLTRDELLLYGYGNRKKQDQVLKYNKIVQKLYKSKPGSILRLNCFLLRLFIKYFYTLRYLIPVLFLANPYMC